MTLADRLEALADAAAGITGSFAEAACEPAPKALARVYFEARLRQRAADIRRGRKLIDRVGLAKTLFDLATTSMVPEPAPDAERWLSNACETLAREIDPDAGYDVAAEIRKTAWRSRAADDFFWGWPQ